MKQLLLVALLLGLASATHAQAALTVLNTFSALRSMSANARAEQQDPQEYTKPVFYEGDMFHYKRTANAAKLPRGGAQIVVLEQLLANRYAVLLPDTVLILSPAWEARYTEALTQVQRTLPTWSTLAYEEPASRHCCQYPAQLISRYSAEAARRCL
jgi:hypothetical protein